MYILTDLPHDILREIVKYLYYEYKMDILSLDNLSATCRLLRSVIDLNGSNSPVTRRDRVRRKHIARVNNDKQIEQLLNSAGRCVFEYLYTDAAHIATCKLILKYRNHQQEWDMITRGPLITIEILLDLIAQSVVPRTTMFSLSRNSAVTVEDLSKYGLLINPINCGNLTAAQYKKYIGDIPSHMIRKLIITEGEIDVQCGYSYYELVGNKHLSVKFLREYRDLHNWSKYSITEIRRFSRDPEYGEAYARELVDLHRAHNDAYGNERIIWSYACKYININFIINNAHIDWNWRIVSNRPDITFELVRNNPQCAWDVCGISPISRHDISNSKHTEIYNLYMRDELCTKTIIDNLDIEWVWHRLARSPKVDARYLMQHARHYPSPNFMFYMSSRNDIDLPILLEYPAWWNPRRLKLLKNYGYDNTV